MPTIPREIKVNKEIQIGGFNPLFLVAGPCVIESEEHAFHMAAEINRICQELKCPYIFKSSFDKANRSSIHSYRGPGLEQGLKILKGIKTELHIPVLSDIHEPWQAEKAADVLNIIQIPAFLCRQTDLVVEAAKTGRPLNIKKGQFLSPPEMKNIIEKALQQQNKDIILTERGTCFGYNNLVLDVRAIPIMRRWGFPVVIDASHTVQKPGGKGTSSGGEADFIPYIAQAGVSVGADGVFIEVHDHPEKARSDSHNSLLLKDLKGFLGSVLRIRRAVIHKDNIWSKD
ncbi:MAG: 3-deoxy-8-phosphooctulonate synthase [Candidatus Aminicenantes bacterium]|nr:3-deoxy-8-phosphooctulonate synthase [Candidatus Aminicenantes bacterium]